MKFILPMMLVLSFNAFAQEGDGVFDFNGQQVEHTRRSEYNGSDVSDRGSECHDGPEVCSYQPVSSQTCDNSIPSHCWTTTTTEYRCSPGPQTCSGWATITIGGDPYDREEAIVTFLNPEFKIEDIPFKFKRPKDAYSSTIVPDLVPENILIGVENAGVSAKEEKLFNVKFFNVSEFQKTTLQGITSASYEVKTGTVTMMVKGRVKRDDKVSIVATAKISRGLFSGSDMVDDKFAGTLRELNARIMDNGNGTTTVIYAKRFGDKASALNISLALQPVFPEKFQMYGDKSKAEVAFKSKVKMVK